MSTKETTFLSELEACIYTGLTRGNLSMRRARGQPPKATTASGEVRYGVQALDDFMRARGARAALHAAKLEDVAWRLLGSNGSEPLEHPELEAASREIALTLLEETNLRVVAARLYGAANYTARALGRSDPGMSQKRANEHAVAFVFRCGWKLARYRRVWRGAAEAVG